MAMRRLFLMWAVRSSLVIGIILAASSSANAQEDFVVLGPGGGRLLRASDGNLYVGSGEALFRINLDGTRVFVSDVPSGLGDPILASDGFIYYVKGFKDIARIALDGSPPTVLYEGPDLFEGRFAGALVEGRDGNFYGFHYRYNGSPSRIFRMTPSGILSTVLELPSGTLVWLTKASDGSLYGTSIGAASAIFRMTLQGSVTTLHTSTDRRFWTPLFESSDGKFYGAFSTIESDCASLFRLDTGNTLTVLSRIEETGCFEAASLSLMEGADKNLYGATHNSIFRITLNGGFRLLHSALGYAAGQRYGGNYTKLVEIDGDFYGTGSGVFSENSSGAFFRLNSHRSACANELDLVWQDYAGGTLYMLGAVKSETPAFWGTWLASQLGISRLWATAIPSVDPTLAYEQPVRLSSRGTVGVFTLVVTSTLKACSKWTTEDTGGTGATADSLKELMQSKGFPIPSQ